MNNEIVIQSPESLIEKSVLEGKVTVETLERLMAMRREMKAEQAKSDYETAMAAFQAECPMIEKTKEVKNNVGKVIYAYAPLESIVGQVKALIQKHGFSYAFDTEMGQETVKVVCLVKHSEGHQEKSSMEIPTGGGTSIMSAPQKVGSAVTFAKRYAFCNAFGILTGDEDTDATPEVINEAAKVVELPKEPTMMKEKIEDPFVDGPKKEKVCLKCGSPMKLRNRKDGTGQFWGCSDFPNCTYLERV